VIIGIGSANPVKRQAVEEAVLAAHEVLGIADRLDFRAIEVASGVAAQPFSDEETRSGAANRIKNLLNSDAEIELAFGLEGGVIELPDGLYSTVWIGVGDRQGRRVFANGNRFCLPEPIAVGIRSGQEMGEVMDQLQQTSGINHREGMLGVVTRGVVTRAQGYAALARLAYGLYLGQS
jgi:inosine/xanthosine triphosphatase